MLRHLQQNLGPVFVRGLALSLAFALQVLLARILGPAGYGIYSLAFSVSLLIIIVTLQGHDIGAMRITAPMIASNALRQFDRYRADASRRIWILGSLVCTGALLLSMLVGWIRSEFWNVMVLMALSVPFIARSRLSQGILRAAGKPTQAYLPEGVLPPLFMIPIIATLAYWMQLSVVTIGAIFLLAAIANWFFAIVLEKRAVPTSGRLSSQSAIGDHAGWGKITTPMYLSALLEAANDKLIFLLLGAMKGEYEAGLYSAASRFVIVAGMIGTTLYLSHASRVSLLYSMGDAARLGAEVGHITRLVVVLTLAVCAPVMVWPEFFLGLFGGEFREAIAPLRILVLATFISVALGPVGLLLNMSEFERTHTRILAATLAVSALSGVVLISFWGITGAALAVLLSTLFWKSAMLLVVRRRMGFIPVLARNIAPPTDLPQAP
jgi:O-antigen/teichoic acid export membrane protein